MVFAFHYVSAGAVAGAQRESLFGFARDQQQGGAALPGGAEWIENSGYLDDEFAAAVRDVLNNPAQRKVCKAFFPHIWKKEGSEALAVTETFEIAASALPEDEVLTYAPAIYQEMIVKDFDVRMVLLGETVYSFSVRTPNGALDWRQEVGQGHVTIEEVMTPEEVERAVLRFAHEARIEFGSLDFAVDREGRWWFLEINEEGQFLWLDEFSPGVRMQEKFLAFLTLPKGARREEIERKQREFPAWKDYLKSPEKEEVPEEEHLAAPILSVEP